MYLFDASALVNLIKRGIVKPFADGVTLDLALYESLNAVWKEYSLLKKLDRETALMFIDIIGQVFSVIEVVSVRGLEKEVFELASRENLTVYDAAYMYIATKRGLVLVTDDEKLKRRASRYTKVVSSGELSSIYYR